MISHTVWNLFFAMLEFPQMRDAFGAFINAPVSSPEAARFRLAGIGPLGPPPPPGMRPMFAPWDAALFDLSADDVLDVESTAAYILNTLDHLVGWASRAPLQDISPDLLRGLSQITWEAFIASLRIPRTLAQFEMVCQNPPAFRVIAGLTLDLTGIPPAEVKHRRPHPHRAGREQRR